MGLDKKGVIYKDVIFLVLNLVFFSILMIFIFSSSSSAGTYEQAYSKQITMLINSARPNTNITLDVTDLDEEYENRGILEMFKVDKNEVIVSLSGRREYRYSFFSDYDVELRSRTEGGNSYLVIIIK